MQGPPGKGKAPADQQGPQDGLLSPCGNYKFNVYYGVWMMWNYSANEFQLPPPPPGPVVMGKEEKGKGDEGKGKAKGLPGWDYSKGKWRAPEGYGNPTMDPAPGGPGKGGLHKNAPHSKAAGLPKDAPPKDLPTREPKGAAPLAGGPKADAQAAGERKRTPTPSPQGEPKAPKAKKQKMKESAQPQSPPFVVIQLTDRWRRGAVVRGTFEDAHKDLVKFDPAGFRGLDGYIAPDPTPGAQTNKIMELITADLSALNTLVAMHTVLMIRMERPAELDSDAHGVVFNKTVNEVLEVHWTEVIQMVQHYKMLRADDLANHDPITGQEVDDRSRLLQKSDYNLYLKICDQYENKPLFPPEVFLLMNIRKRRQAGRRLVKDQEGLDWISDSYVVDRLRELSQGGWTSMKKSLKEGKGINVPHSLKYREAYAKETFLVDSDDEGNPDYSPKVPAVPRLTECTVSAFLDRYLNPPAKGPAYVKLEPYVDPAVPITGVMENFGTGWREIENEFCAEVHDSMQHIKAVEDAVDYWISSGQKPVDFAQGVASFLQDESELKQGALETVKEFREKSLEHTPTEASKRIDPSTFMRSLRPHAGVKANPETDSEKIWYSDFITNASAAQGVKVSKVYATDLIDSLRSHKKVFYPTRAWGTQDCTKSENPNEIMSQVRDGVKADNNYIFEKAPYGMTGLQFLSPQEIDDIDWKEVAKHAESYGYTTGKDCKNGQFPLVKRQVDANSNPVEPEAGKPCPLEIENVDVSWGVQGIETVMLCRCNDKTDMFGLLLRGSNAMPMKNQQHGQKPVHAFQVLEGLACDSSLGRSVMTFGDINIGLKNLFENYSNDGKGRILLLLLSVGVQHKCKKKDGDVNHGSRLSTRLPLHVLAGCIMIDDEFTFSDIPKSIPSYFVHLPESVAFSVGISMRGSGALYNFDKAYVLSIVESDKDVYAKIMQNFMHVLLRNDQHAVFDPKDMVQGFDFGANARFPYKRPEKLLLEGLLWAHVSEAELKRVCGILWRVFSGNDENSLMFRQRMFAACARLECEYTTSGWATGVSEKNNLLKVNAHYPYFNSNPEIPDAPPDGFVHPMITAVYGGGTLSKCYTGHLWEQM